MPITNSEHQLIKSLIKGDSLAFDELYKQYYNKVYSFSFRYLQNKQDAEGVVQEVFIKVWNNRKHLNEIKNLNAWVFTITFNQIKKIFRNLAIEKRNMEKVAISAVFDDNSVISEVEFNDLMAKANDIIERLPSRQKTAFKLSFKEGLTSKEISEQLGIHKRTVENHLFSARAFLKKVFKEENLIPLVIYWLLL